MGMGTALALVDAGFTVAGYDVDPAKLEHFAEGGGIACNSAAALAGHADRVITMVVNAAQVENVLFGEEGLASGSQARASISWTRR